MYVKTSKMDLHRCTVHQKYQNVILSNGCTKFGDRIPVWRDFPPIQTGLGAHPASCTIGTGSNPGVKYGRGLLLTTHPLLVPGSWKSRAIALLALWATTGPITESHTLFSLARMRVYRAT